MYTGHRGSDTRVQILQRTRTVRKGVNLAVLGRGSVNSAEARKSVLSVDVHGTRPTDTLSARPPEGKSGVDLILYFDQRVENLRSWC